MALERNEDSEDENEDDDATLGGLFTIKNSTSKKKKPLSIFHEKDYSKDASGGSIDLNYEELLESIKDCFVTGKWDSSKDAANVLADASKSVFFFTDLVNGLLLFLLC